MAGDGQSGPNIPGELRGFGTIKISRNVAFRYAAVNGQEGDIDVEAVELFDETVV